MRPFRTSRGGGLSSPGSPGEVGGEPQQGHHQKHDGGDQVDRAAFGGGYRGHEPEHRRGGESADADQSKRLHHPSSPRSRNPVAVAPNRERRYLPGSLSNLSLQPAEQKQYVVPPKSDE